MAAAEQRHEQLFNDGLLADDHFAQLGLHVVIGLLESFDSGEFFGGQIRCLRLRDPDLRLHESSSKNTPGSTSTAGGVPCVLYEVGPSDNTGPLTV